MIRRFGRLRALPLAALISLGACHDIRDSQQRRISARVAAENAVLAASLMPSSLVIRNERVFLHKDGPVVCGEYDGLNRDGDMEGFRQFVFAKDDIVFDMDQPNFAARWDAACRP